jgi:hypothetical protein
MSAVKYGDKPEISTEYCAVCQILPLQSNANTLIAPFALKEKSNKKSLLCGMF